MSGADDSVVNSIGGRSLTGSGGGCNAATGPPIPFIFYRYGAKIRQRSKYAPTAPPAPASGSSAEEDEKENDNDTALAAVIARRDSVASGANKESA